MSTCMCSYKWQTISWAKSIYHAINCEVVFCLAIIKKVMLAIWFSAIFESKKGPNSLTGFNLQSKIRCYKLNFHHADHFIMSMFPIVIYIFVTVALATCIDFNLYWTCIINVSQYTYIDTHVTFLNLFHYQNFISIPLSIIHCRWY